MKQGELRRFKDVLCGSDLVEQCSGLFFMVLKVDRYSDGGLWADILLEGKIDPGWGGNWIEENSEVLNEAG